jgi:predicted RND superfamily exporter protein
MAQLLPEKDSINLQYKEFKAIFGQDGGIMIVAIKDENFFNLKTLTLYWDLQEQIQEVPEVNKVLSILNTTKIVKNDSLKKYDLKPLLTSKPNSQSEIDILKSEIENLPFYDKLLFNKQSGTYLMLLTLDPSILNSKERLRVTDQIEKYAEEYEEDTNAEVYLSGLPYIRTNNVKKGEKEVTKFVILAIIVTAIFLFILFRSFYEVVFPLIVVLVGVIWSVGLLVLLGFEVTLLTGLIPPLMIVIGVPNSIFMINKFHKEYKSHGNKIRALTRTIERVGNAILFTNITTAIGFATFTVTSSVILIEFGIVASISILMLFFVSITLNPIIFSYLPNPSIKRTKHLEKVYVKKLVRRLIIFSQYHRKWVYAVTIIVFMFSIYGITLIEIRGNIVDDLPEESRVMQDLHSLEKSFGGVMPFEIFIDAGKPRGASNDPKIWAKIDELQDFLKEQPELSRPLSIVELIKFANQAYYNGNPAFYTLPSKLDRGFILSYIKKEEDKTANLGNFMDSTGQIARVSVQLADINTKQISEIRDKVQNKLWEVFPPSEYRTFLTGSSLVFLEGIGYLVKNLFLSLGLAVLLIAVFMALMFRSFRMIIISLIPNILPLLFTAGLMGYFDIPLKPSTVLIFSIALGISIDDTIHFLAKYRQELKLNNHNIRISIVNSLKETGVSMTYTSVVLFFGFSVFTASEFGGTKALGSLVSITLFAAMLSNLVLLPSLLMSLRKRILEKSFIENPIDEILDIEPEDEDEDIQT